MSHLLLSKWKKIKLNLFKKLIKLGKNQSKKIEIHKKLFF